MKWKGWREKERREKLDKAAKIRVLPLKPAVEVVWKERSQRAAGCFKLSLLTSISLRTMSTMLPITTRASNTFQASPKYPWVRLSVWWGESNVISAQKQEGFKSTNCLFKDTRKPLLATSPEGLVIIQTVTDCRTLNLHKFHANNKITHEHSVTKKLVKKKKKDYF